MIHMDQLSSYIIGGVLFITILAGNVLKSHRRVSIAVRLVYPLVMLLYSLILYHDPIRIFFVLLTGLIGVLIVPYTDAYERSKFPGRNLCVLIDMFVLSLFLVFTSENLINLVLFWLFTDIIGFLAIVFEPERRTLRAGLRYTLVATTPADISLLLLLGVVFMKHNLIGIVQLPLSEIGTVLTDADPVLKLIILLGFMAKAAVAPLHFWLPDAHSLAPAPAAAVLSGIAVKMGMYGMLLTITAVEPIIAYIVIGFASITVIYGGLQAIVQNDIKRLLAYSTIENTSLITLAAAAYGVFKYNVLLQAALLFSIAHGLFKASLFMNSGTIEILTHTREISKLGYISKISAKPTLSAVISVLSLIGSPPTAGFIGKLFLFIGFATVVFDSPLTGIVLIALAGLGAALSAVYSIKYLTIYWGGANPPTPHDIPRSVGTEIPEMILSLSGIFASTLMLIVAGILDIIYILPLIVLTTMFATLIYYVYTFVKKGTETHWIGGMQQ